VFKKEDKKDREVRGGESSRHRNVRSQVHEERKSEHSCEIRSVIFTGLFEHPLKSALAGKSVSWL